MFFLFPVNTDAPIYHWPIGTVGLIIVNTLLFFLLPNPEAYALQHGQGLDPLQWVTSNFIHGGFFHLIGNMIFLWGFGLVVEGKLGTPLFLLVYMAIGVVQCALEQILMLGAGGTGASFGASAIIYGLLAICLVWAPKNDFTVFVFVFFFRVIATTFEASILTFGMLYLGIEFLFAFFTGFQFGSEILHLSGAAIGAGVGFLFLNRKWVDCEGWDLISVMRKQHGRQLTSNHNFLPEVDYQLKTKSTSRKKRKRKTTETSEDPEELLRNRRQKRLEKIRRHIAEDKPMAALQEYESAKLKYGEFHLPAEEMKRLADGFYRMRRYGDAIPLYEQFLNRFSGLASDSMRLRLAGMYVEFQQRPKAALRTIEPLDSAQLGEKLRKLHQQITRKANELIDEGVLELEGQSW